MASIKFNKKNIQLSLAKPIEAAALPAARELARERFNGALNELVNEIERDSASQEIMDGNDVVKSAFIKGPGADKHGANLFSFLGFTLGSTPIQDLINYIKKSTNINVSNAKLVNDRYIFKINGPTEGDVRKAFPHDENFLGGRSWINSLERGLSNVVNYIRKLGAPDSRSQGGIQIENVTRKIFTPKKDFFTEKYRKYIRRLKGID